MILIEREKIRFAVVGAGHIGKRHCTMIQRNPEAELVAISDIKDQNELGLSEFGEVPFFNSMDKMLAAGLDIDVAVIASPNGLHAQQAMKVLEAEKHVVIEKPMALSKADAEKVIHKALNVSRHVFGVMQNRYSPPSVWIREMIEEKRLGDIYMVQVNCYWNRDERYYRRDTWHGDRELDGGTLFTQFSHFVDIMYWLFGDIENIKAQSADFNHKDLTDFEDSGMVQFRFVNGGMGCINYSTSVWDSNLESSLTVIGEKGSIRIGGQYMGELEVCHVKGYEMPQLPPANPANDYGAYKGSAANHVYITENVIDTLKGRTSIATNALEGLKVVDIIERIYASMKC